MQPIGILILFLAPQSDARAPAFAPGVPGLEIGANGVVREVPDATLRTVDGPLGVLHPGSAEAFGVAFGDARGRHAAVGRGRAQDWAGRADVTPLSFTSRNGHARAVGRAEELEIESVIEVERDLLVFVVTLTNRGPEPLQDLVYTREFRASGEEGWFFPPDAALDAGRPADVARRGWELGELAPGACTGLAFAYRIGAPRVTLGAVEVPLALFRNADWPNGLQVGATNGVSLGDFDGDGWVDLFACESGRLLRNVLGSTWELAAELDPLLPETNIRYGSSFGDYDNDGLADIGTEPRAGLGDGCLHLLHNLGGAQFVDVATDPTLVIGQPCEAPAETIGWADVDEDSDLDLFLPVYPHSSGGPGNFFLENLGPSGPLGAYRFEERSAQDGLNNPPHTARPEGAQFVDVDDDGDPDLYSNGTLYQNRSEDHVDFDAMEEAGSGIGLRGSLDEGAAFFDYDLDGDLDLFIVYTQRGVRFWESRGDGTFRLGEGGVIDEPNTGLDLGLSAEDWDNDGDVDFTTRGVFRRNRFVEDGVRHFTVATNSIPAQHLTSATPAWGDWDKDGDLDCALGNWRSIGHFYENTLYDASVPADRKPYVRVRVARDDPDVPRGLDTEYGARVELVLHGDPLRRVKFVASGNGYLNQNEYALHFALPSGPDAEHPLAGLVFDVVVDFPSRASRGVLRVDRFVNPALGDIALADLAEREITVFRSGRVELSGQVFPPVRDGLAPRLFASAGGLALADPALGLPDPEPAPGAATWVGIELEAADQPALVKELVLDGQLAAPLKGAPFNLALWDVSDAAHPRRVLERSATTSARNRRTHFPFVALLEPRHAYRCVALVDELRPTLIQGPVTTRGLRVKGGLEFLDPDPTSGKQLVRAAPDASRVFLALRFATRELRLPASGSAASTRSR